MQLTGSSGQTTLVPDANIVLAGSGASRTVTVTPAANQFGSALITLTVTDEAGNTATDTFTVTVNAIADTPVTGGATSTNEDTVSAAISITRNSVDGAEITHFKVSAITGGTLYKNANETGAISNGDFITAAEAAGVYFKPSLNSNSTNGGPFSFQVNGARDSSGTGLSPTAATVTLTVTAVNDLPTDIALSASSLTVFDDVNRVIGTLSATDVDHTSHTFSIVSVNGQTTGTAFSAFDTSGTSLRAVSPASLSAGTYAVIVRATDGAGDHFDKSLSVTVTDQLIVTVNSDDGVGATDTDSAADTTVAAAIADGGGLSLREALYFAGNKPAGATIQFAAGLAGQTITLATDAVVAAGLTLDADPAGTLPSRALASSTSPAGLPFPTARTTHSPSAP